MKTRLLSFLHPVKRAFLCALLAGAAVTSLRADVPLLINYQGRVTTAAGTPHRLRHAGEPQGHLPHLYAP